MRLEKKIHHTGNTVVNKYESFSEILIYKKDFEYNTGRNLDIDTETGEVKKDEINRVRKFVKGENNMLHPISDIVTIDDYKNTIADSAKRAKDNFYGYALANTWRYFFTLVVDSNEHGSDDDVIINDLWRKFRLRLYKFSSSVKVLAVPERHVKTETKKIHFHGFLGDIDLTDKMRVAINPKNGKEIKSRYGQQVYNLNLWSYGFSTIVELDTSQDNQLQVVNYLLKYITKNSNIGYCRKKYYRTRNLDFKQKDIFKLSATEKENLMSDIMAVKYKETENLIVYRIDNKNAEYLKSNKVIKKN